MPKIIQHGATGRRKSSVARIKLSPGKGTIYVNHKPFDQYFPFETMRLRIVEPLKVTNTISKFDITASVTGGGSTGQAGAITLGLARALAMCDEEYKTILKKANFLRRDPRMKERQKPGQKGARKKFQWVKR